MAKTSSPTILTSLSFLFIVLCGGYAAWSLVRIISTTAPDFAFYYGQVPNLLPPPSVVLYLPLRLIPFRIMEGLWVLGSLVLLVDVVRRVAFKINLRSFSEVGIVASIAFLSFPSRFTLGMGQVNIIALWLLVRSWEQTAPMWSGILFAIAVLFKPELAILGIPILYEGRWKMCIAATGIIAVFSGLALLLWGMPVYQSYFLNVSSLFSDSSGLAIYYNQGITGMLVRAGIWDRLLFTVIATLLIGGALRAIKHTIHNKWDQTIWLFMPALLLIEPLAWQHHLVFLIPTYILVWRTLRGSMEKSLFISSLVLISWNFTNPANIDTMPLAWLALSHGTIGILILWGLLLRR